MNLRIPFHYRTPWTLLAALSVALGNSVVYSEGTTTRGTSAIFDDQITPVTCWKCGLDDCECELICNPRKVAETETKSFWKVTCEYVCIPGFRFPWECKKNSTGRECLVCGTVRAVNVLEQEDYECESCGYKWEIKCVRRRGESASRDCQCPRCAEKERTRLATQSSRERR